jgi:hypothetical protein
MILGFGFCFVPTKNTSLEALVSLSNQSRLSTKPLGIVQVAVFSCRRSWRDKSETTSSLKLFLAKRLYRFSASKCLIIAIAFNLSKVLI